MMSISNWSSNTLIGSTDLLMKHTKFWSNDLEKISSKILNIYMNWDKFLKWFRRVIDFYFILQLFHSIVLQTVSPYSMTLHDRLMSLGVVHKWRHTFFDNFWPPLPFVTRFITKALVLSSQNPWPPPPPKTVTSFMDDPLCKLPSWAFLEIDGVFFICIIIVKLLIKR